MFKRIVGFIIIGLITLGVSGCSLGVKENKDKYTAVVEAESFYIPAEVNGKVTEVSVSQGDSIKLGEKLAQIDAKAYELQKQQAEAALKLATLKQDDIPDSAKDNIKAQAKLAVDQAQAAVDIAQLQIDRAQVIALNEGTVTDVFIHKGEMISIGMNIAKAINLKEKYIKVYIEEEKRSVISLNDIIPVFFNDIKYDEGKVVYISEESEFTPKNVEKKIDKEKTVFEVKLKLSEKSDLKPGMLVDVEIR